MKKVIVVDFIVLFWGMLCQAYFCFILLFLTWINMMFYTYRKIEQRGLLFAFGIAFFVFLLGREMLEQLFGYEPDTKFPDQINIHTYFSLFIALAAVWGAYFCFSKRLKNWQISLQPNVDKPTPYTRNVRKISQWMFFATYPFALIMNIAIAIFVASFGYSSYYTDYSEVLSGNSLLYLISKLELIMPAAFCIFMATYPSKKEFKTLAIPYVIYLVITLGGGQRSTFVLGLLLLFVFMVYMQGIRSQEKWFHRKYVKYGIFALPFLAIGGSLYNLWRFDGDWQDLDFFSGFCNFFYDQGVSSYIIKRAYEYQNNIPKCTYVLEFLHSGILAPLLGFTVYHGNTIEHAMYGNSFTHALGYVVMDEMYLAGRGTGSSYVAELFFDFGYIGIALGSLLYGWIFTQIGKTDNGGLFRRAVVFVCITQLLWAPRASFVGFLSFLFAPTTLVLFAVTFLLPKIFVKGKSYHGKGQR
ncbi:O-antigen polysaccharide polymerase Wzy family protein [uncultured Bacteroides sp.]|uniref:O-antigen polysaccharide polymerase Wzy family protein n=1 Tax=uncultured Bacteroides sp. TaxID=162156 RepID=UPI00262ADBA0|nr:O-antigen polysaccharide polymerase Wzy family protein [uncultured Bacteroides sp.]